MSINATGLYWVFRTAFLPGNPVVVLPSFGLTKESRQNESRLSVNGSETDVIVGEDVGGNQEKAK